VRATTHPGTAGPLAPPPSVLTRGQWVSAAAAHAERADALTVAHRARRAVGEHHPIEDFLDYYRLRPLRLRRWHPVFGVGLAGPDVPQASWRWYASRPGTDGGPVVRLDLPGFRASGLPGRA